jgi:hypothetical protein
MHFRRFQKVINLTRISKIETLSCSLKHLQDNMASAVRHFISLFTQLQVKYHVELHLGEVLKDKGLVYWQPSAKTRVDILEHVLHLVFVIQE